MAMQVHLKATVRGRVQGVYFRAFVKGHARRLGLKGFVRNLPDFTMLEIEAEGDRTKLETLLDGVKVGPPGARVDQVEVEWSEYRGVLNEFDIMY